jgi:hypothetical protein
VVTKDVAEERRLESGMLEGRWSFMCLGTKFLRIPTAAWLHKPLVFTSSKKYCVELYDFDRSQRTPIQCFNDKGLGYRYLACPNT